MVLVFSNSIGFFLGLILTKFIKIEIQGDSMRFKSLFFPWYFKSLLLVNRKEKRQKFRNLGRFKDVFFP
jgi:hypothetical protein